MTVLSSALHISTNAAEIDTATVEGPAEVIGGASHTYKAFYTRENSSKKIENDKKAKYEWGKDGNIIKDTDSVGGRQDHRKFIFHNWTSLPPVTPQKPNARKGTASCTITVKSDSKTGKQPIEMVGIAARKAMLELE